MMLCRRVKYDNYRVVVNESKNIGIKFPQKEHHIKATFTNTDGSTSYGDFYYTFDDISNSIRYKNQLEAKDWPSYQSSVVIFRQMLQHFEPVESCPEK